MLVSQPTVFNAMGAAPFQTLRYGRVCSAQLEAVMITKSYRLIFEGRIVPGREIEEVRRNLRSLFNIDDDRIERLFAGQPILIKKDVDYETALKYKDAFERAGAICRLEETEESDSPSPRPVQMSQMAQSPEGPPPTQPRAPGRDRFTKRISRPPILRSTGRRYSIFHPLFMSFFSKDFYQDVGKNWKGFSFVYLLFILFLCWLPSVVAVQHKISDSFMKSAREFLVQVPRITISHGEVSIDQEEPYFIRDPENGDIFAIIDTTGQFTSLNGVAANALITKKKAIIRKSKRETRTFDLSDIESFTLDQNFINKWLRIFEKWFAIIFLPFAVFASFIYRTIQVLIYAVIGVLFNKVAKADLNYQALISLSIMSITPVLILDTILGLTEVAIPLWGLWCFVISMGILYYGVKVNAGQRFLDELSSL